MTCSPGVVLSALLLSVAAGGLGCSEGTSPGGGQPLPLKFITIQVSHTQEAWSTCGIAADSTTYCWGSNFRDQLGTVSTETCEFGECSRRPLKVDGPRLTSLTGGRWYHCGLDPGGAPYCWGWIVTDIDGGFDLGQVPTLLPGGLTLTQISGSGNHICGGTPANEAYCWGDFLGGLRGDGTVDLDTADATLQPNRVSGGITFQSVAGSLYGTCGRASDGAVHCWGRDAVGMLGNPAAPTDTACGFPGIGPCLHLPHPIAGGVTFTTLTAGAWHYCGLDPAGAAFCWGSGASNQLSNYGDLEVCSYLSSLYGLCATGPVTTWGGVDRLAAIAAGGESTCGIDSAGTGYCWGNNDYGQLGTRGGRLPAAIEGGLAFRMIAPGFSHSCGLTVDSLAYCWGRNFLGQLGNGTTIDSPVPVAVLGPATR